MLARVALAAVLVVAAALRLWRIDQNGFGNEYYSAAVRSMAMSWHNFLYAAFDPAGFVSVDKPPLALWIQVAAVTLFGFHGLSVLVPQVVEGLAAVGLAYHLVARRFGVAAGLLAGLFLAVTPVNVAIDRSSNTDSCLVLVLLLAAWALIRAAETGRRRLLLLAMALIGLGFNVKMLAAYVVLPAFAVVYLLGTGFDWRRRLVDGGTATVVLAAISVAWILVYDLTPPSQRPYAGTTDTNSVAELAVGPYGIGRFVRQVRPSVAAGEERDPGQTGGPAVRRPTTADGPPRTAYARLFVRVPTGPLRLVDGRLAGQMAWLLPLAIAGIVLGVVRRPPAPAPLTLILWITWALTFGVVYSYAGGIFHFYYLATLGPPLAALAGIGVTGLWEVYSRKGWGAAWLPLTLVVTAAWQLHVNGHALRGLHDALSDFTAIGHGATAWLSSVHLAIAAGIVLSAAALLVAAAATTSRRAHALGAGALAVGLFTLLTMPAAWALSSVFAAGSSVLPSADLARLLPSAVAEARAPNRTGDGSNVSTLIGFLRANRHGERYVLATSSVTLAAPIIIRTGEAVMARGGFHGLDPILTPERLAGLVDAREVRFATVDDLTLVSRRMGAETAGRPVADWIRAHGRLVDPTLWRAGGGPARMTLYDLRPELGIVQPPTP